MTEALILIKTNIGKMKEVYEKVKEKKEVKKASMLTGPYDVMVIAEAEDFREITDILITEIRTLDGVKETVTNLAID